MSLMLTAVVLSACGPNVQALKSLSFHRVNDVKVEELNLSNFDVNVGVEMTNRSQKNITFDRIEVDVLGSGELIAHLSLRTSVVCTAGSSTVSLPVKVNVKRSALSAITDGLLGRTERMFSVKGSISLRAEGANKNAVVKFNRKVTPQTVEQLIPNLNIF